MLLIFIQVDIQSLQRVMLCNARKLTFLNQLKNINDPVRQEAVRLATGLSMKLGGKHRTLQRKFTARPSSAGNF